VEVGTAKLNRSAVTDHEVFCTKKGRSQGNNQFRFNNRTIYFLTQTLQRMLDGIRGWSFSTGPYEF
jgi:hypothetical protein